MSARETVQDAAQKVEEAIAERENYELKAAWRAGYDWLHVYDGLHMADVGTDPFTIKRYFLPSDTASHPEPDFATYSYSYDISAVDDDEVLAALHD